MWASCNSKFTLQVFLGPAEESLGMRERHKRGLQLVRVAIGPERESVLPSAQLWLRRAWVWMRAV